MNTTMNAVRYSQAQGVRPTSAARKTEVSSHSEHPMARDLTEYTSIDFSQPVHSLTPETCSAPGATPPNVKETPAPTGMERSVASEPGVTSSNNGQTLYIPLSDSNEPWAEAYNEGAVKMNSTASTLLQEAERFAKLLHPEQG